jgi:pilus assembly protein CpaE
LLSGPAFAAPEHPNFPVAIDRISTCARSLFPLTLLELDDCWRKDYADILRQSNTVILCCRLDFVAIRNARRALDHFDRVGVAPEQVLLVAQRVGQRGELPLRKAEGVLGRKMVGCVPNDPATVNASTNLGVPVVLESPRSRFAKQLALLSVSLAEQAPAARAEGMADESAAAPRSWLQKCASWGTIAQ